MGRSRLKQTGRKLGWALLLVLWVGCALLASQYLMAWVFRAIFSEESLPSAALQTLYAALVYILCLVLTIFVPSLAMKYKTTREELGLRGLPTWTDIFLAPVGLALFMVVAALLTALLMQLLPGIDWTQAQETGYENIIGGSDFTLAFVALVILAPVAEEIVFRGWLYGKLRARMTALPAIILVSGLFGVMHGQWNVGVTVFTMSLAMCVMRELTGTIWAGIILHMLKNGIAFYFLFVNPIL